MWVWAGELAAQAQASEGPPLAPYLFVLAIGFAVGAYGHAAKARWLIAIGILLIIAAIVLFQLEVRNEPDNPPPGV
jgi:mannose/fructose/N-acetylgalactosamine-specific phosphotransferase system component IIC